MSLKVFDLQCELGHVFEGWFASSDAYESQKAGGLLSCPVCNSTSVSRKVSAARLNIGHLKRERLEQPGATGTGASADRTGAGATRTPGAAATAQSRSGARGAGGVSVAQPLQADTQEIARLQAEMLQHLRKVLRETENVGSDFAEESRRIHYGESDLRPIRGTATLQECEELAEEGIGVVAIPDFFDDDRLQ